MKITLKSSKMQKCLKMSMVVFQRDQVVKSHLSQPFTPRPAGLFTWLFRMAVLFGMAAKLVKAKPVMMQRRLEPFQFPGFVQPKTMFVCFFCNFIILHAYINLCTEIVLLNHVMFFCYFLTEHAHSTTYRGDPWRSVEYNILQHDNSPTAPPSIHTESSGNVSR